jgi:hypothetical protein
MIVMKLTKIFITVMFGILCVSAFLGQTSYGTDADIKMQESNLKGKIAGKDWEAVFAKKSAAQFDPETISIAIYPKAEKDVDWFSPDAVPPAVLMVIPKKIGKFKFGEKISSEWKLHLTLCVGFDNTIIDEGILEIFEITDEKVVLGVVANFDANNFVNGKVEVPLKTVKK